MPIPDSMLSPMSWLWEGGEDRRVHHSRVPVGTKLGGGKGLLLDVLRDTPHCLGPLNLDMQTDNRPMGQPGQCGACSELHRSPGPKSSPFSSFIGIAHGYNLRMTWESAEPNLQNCFQTRTGQIVPSLQASPNLWIAHLSGRRDIQAHFYRGAECHRVSCMFPGHSG